MLRAIEAAHAGVGLRPDDQIERREAEFRCSRMNSRQAPPVDEAAEDAAVTKVGKNSRHPRFVEGEKLGVAHLAGSHGELAVTSAGDIARDLHVVGLIG